MPAASLPRYTRTENEINFPSLLRLSCILVAIGVDENGYREVIGAAEGMKEDAESWKNFLVWLKERGLDGVKLVIGDKCLGMYNAVAEVFPEAKYIQIVTDAYKKYARYKDKNLNQLMEFSKVARVKEKVRRYMEVLL